MARRFTAERCVHLFERRYCLLVFGLAAAAAPRQAAEDA